MKKSITLVIALMISVASFAQPGFNYKAMVKDGDGNLVINQNIDLKFTLEYDGGVEFGIITLYEELHNTSTDINGIVIVNIGEGTLVSGSFPTTNWIQWTYIIIEVDLEQDGTFVNLGTSYFKKVPMAIHAKRADIATTANNVVFENSFNKVSNSGGSLQYDDFVFGSAQLNNDQNSNIDNSRMFFDKDQGAFRAGITSDNGGTASEAWDFSNRGEASFATGNGTIASGTNSTALGLSTEASGTNSAAFGSATTASGDDSTAMGWFTIASGSQSTAKGYSTLASGAYSSATGYGTVASGLYSTAIGLISTASGSYSTAIGAYLTAPSAGEFVIGSNNLNYTLSNTNGLGDTNWNPTDRLFVIGNGESTSLKSNAVTILKNGKVGIGRDMPASLLEVAHGNTPPTFEDRTDAFSIRNKSTNQSWQFHTSTYLNLYFNGSFRGSWNSTSGAYVQASDRRVKKDITSIENGTLNKVMRLNPVSYLMKDQTDTKRNLGLISQEVQEIFPSITHYVEESDLLTLSYTELIPVLIKALQEQQNIIDTQNQKIDVQGSKIEQFEASIKNLIQRMERLEPGNQ
jgi:hypothetical protein